MSALTKAALFDSDSNVNIFENLAGRDADQSLRRFHQIIPLPPRVLAAEAVDEGQVGTQLSCLYQKTRSVGLPCFCFCFHFHSNLKPQNLFAHSVTGVLIVARE